MDSVSNIAQVAFVEAVKREIIVPLIGFLLAASIVVFVYGVFEFMSTGDSKKMLDGKKHIMWGIVGIFIIVSFAGIMSFVNDTVLTLFS